MKKFKRNCPKCGTIVRHTLKHNCLRAKKEKHMCPKCSALYFSKKFKGRGNPFYGKTHTLEAKRAIGKQDRAHMHTKKFSTAVIKGMDGKTNKIPVYDCWVIRYGKKTADRKFRQLKQVLSEAFSGAKNPMFGKPSPPGSGCGLSGWYKNFFFRSLRELNYILLCEKQNLSIKSAEIKEFRIALPTGKNYFADFIIPGKLIECKPKALWNLEINLIKQKAAQSFCKKLGLSFEIIDPGTPDQKILNSLFKNKEIQFTKLSERKYKEYVKINSL
jgi:hypothetical protein